MNILLALENVNFGNEQEWARASANGDFRQLQVGCSTIGSGIGWYKLLDGFLAACCIALQNSERAAKAMSGTRNRNQAG
jgi:hypothetical protein